MTKVCLGCDVEKSANNFSFNAGEKSYSDPYCLYCSKKRKSAVRVSKEDAGWERSIKRNYKLTPLEYQNMLNKQGGVCAICFKGNDNGRRLSVDHDHKTGKIRGLLCNNHNVAIGHFRDNVQDLNSAIYYLMEHNDK